MDYFQGGSYESVGTKDYMPAWAYGRRLHDIRATFDVFSVGKVIWAMVAGERTCPLWYVLKGGFNLEKRFPTNEDIVWINDLLGKIVVEDEEKMTISDGSALLSEIDAVIYRIRMRAVPPEQANRKDRICRLCFSGHYKFETSGHVGNFSGTRCLRCDRCGHLEFVKLQN